MALSAEQAAEQANVISRLTAEEIPVKLRCSLCTNLAINAFRLPCCGQAICENCQPNLPSTCPVCEHSPLSAADASPNKALRMTVRAFLKTKTAEKKTAISKEHDHSLLSQANSIIPSAIALSTAAISEPTIGVEEAQSTLPADLAAPSTKKSETEAESQVDIPRQSVEETSNVSSTGANGNTFTTEGNEMISNDQDSTKVETRKSEELTERKAGVTGYQGNGIGESTSFENQNTPNAMQWNNNIPNNPMMMQPMQNGMSNGNWPDYSSMMGGMPGMNMVDMSNMGMNPGMYGGYGGPGTGMEGMNMGMGMGFDTSQSGYMGWNGQPNWNIAQDNFNPMTNGTQANAMGAYGYSPATASGYNHFNQMNHQHFQNDYAQGNHMHSPAGFQHGRGRGFGRGRGHYGPSNSSHSTFQNQFPSGHPQQQLNQVHGAQGQSQGQGQVQDQDQIQSQAQGQTESGKNDQSLASGEVGKSVEPGTAELSTSTGLEIDNPSNSNTDAPIPQSDTQIDMIMDEGSQETTTRASENNPAFNDAANVPMLENAAFPPRGPAAHFNSDYAHEFAGAGRGRGNPRGGFAFRGRGNGAWNGAVHVGANNDQFESPFNSLEAQGQGVAGAPKAPKALRDGFPNTGYRRGGFGVAGRGGNVISTGPAEIKPRPESPPPEQKQVASPPLSRASSLTHGSDKRRHRHRSSSASSSTARERKRSHHRHESSSRHKDKSDSKVRKSRSPSTHRSRSPTPPHKRSSRRDRHRERDRELAATGAAPTSSTKQSHSSRRSHRDRDRERERSSSRDRDRHRSRRHDSRSRRESRADREGEREQDDQHSRRHSRRQSRSEQAPLSASSSNHAENPSRRSSAILSSRSRAAASALIPSSRSRPQNPRTNGSGSNNTSTAHDPKASSKTMNASSNEQNSHDREREERNRERLLKEQQRRSELQSRSSTSTSTRKRPREDREVDEDRDDEDGSRRGSRARHSRSNGLSSRSGGGGGGGTTGRRGYRYEDEESDEARALRVENEREDERWG